MTNNHYPYKITRVQPTRVNSSRVNSSRVRSSKNSHRTNRIINMDKFIGRKEELASLQELYNKKGFQMAVLFGRRRVGKTTLINKFIENNKCKSVSFVSTEMTEKELLERMGNDVLDSLAPNLSGKLKFESFDSIFDFIAEESDKERLVFVIDEYPYLSKSCPFMDSLLQKYIDNKWKK